MEILHCLSKTRLATEILRVYLYSFFTIKTRLALATSVPYGILILRRN